MKNIKMAIFITCLLLMPITAFALGANLIGITFTIFYVIFGMVEIIAKTIIGKTVTQDTRLLSTASKVRLTISMVLGWGALIVHLWGLL